MEITSEFGEALNVLMRHDVNAEAIPQNQLEQAVQKMHIIMTGGPAPTPEQANATVQELSHQLIGYLEALES